MIESSETPPAGETSDLQFDHAEAASEAPSTPSPTDHSAWDDVFLECDSCSTRLSQAYYAVGDTALCGSCKDELVTTVEARTQPARFVRALAYGVPTAMLGSAIYYAILAVTDYEIGLVSILIGFMVGAAVRAASGPGGGKRYQFLAAGLTYCAIVTTYVPFVIEGIEEAQQEEMEMDVAAADISAAESTDAAVAPPDASAEPTPEVPPSASELLLAFVFVFGVAFVAPFLAGLENIMGILIIGFGVYQAWKMNKHLEFEITGPHSVGAQPAEST
ncbi:MAG: hypothetical protein ACRBN8_04780 [Nannocystales bacterium]